MTAKPLRYHPAVQQDINAAMRFYLENASEKVAFEFWSELSRDLLKIQANPKHFHFDESGLRRLNLRRFPYHVLYEILPDRIRVQVVRHHSRNPEFGTRRKWGKNG